MVVGLNAAHPRRSDEDVVWPRIGEEATHCRLVEQVEFSARASHEVGEAVGVQAAQDRRADHAAVAGHADARIGADVIAAHRNPQSARCRPRRDRFPTAPR